MHTDGTKCGSNWDHLFLMPYPGWMSAWNGCNGWNGIKCNWCGLGPKGFRGKQSYPVVERDEPRHGSSGWPHFWKFPPISTQKIKKLFEHAVRTTNVRTLRTGFAIILFRIGKPRADEVLFLNPPQGNLVAGFLLGNNQPWESTPTNYSDT